MNVLNKPFILFTTPRSGSTPIYQILAKYLEQNYGTYGAVEILNPYYGKYWMENGALCHEPSANRLTPLQLKSELAVRQELAKRNHGKIFFKMFPFTIGSPEQFDWMLENYQFFTHERANIFEQVLSYLVSMLTQQWYIDGGFSIKEKSLVGKYEHFRIIESTLMSFHLLKKKLSPVASFFYEDLILKDPKLLLIDAGLTLPLDSSDLFLTPKQNKNSKNELFINIDEINNWYLSSSLNRLSPLT